MRAALLLISGLVLVVVTVWIGRGSSVPVYEVQPRGIMGTDCRIVVTGPTPAIQIRAAAAAEAALREVEVAFSDWLDDAPVGRFNRATAGARLDLDGSALALIDRAYALLSASEGAFDASCGPLVRLWRQAGRTGVAPDAAASAEAQALTAWRGLERRADGWYKLVDGARIDLGGIAKGYAIDRATEALLAAGASGGLVDVGGDLRVVGQAPSAGWSVAVRHPEGGQRLIELGLSSGQAVCTSGDYARFVEIDGQRFSHIVDPRSGRPLTNSASVTVVAASAEVADAWATALSVLGPAGFDRLPPGCAAFLVQRQGEQLVSTASPAWLTLVSAPTVESPTQQP